MKKAKCQSRTKPRRPNFYGQHQNPEVRHFSTNEENHLAVWINFRSILMLSRTQLCRNGLRLPLLRVMRAIFTNTEICCAVTKYGKINWNVLFFLVGELKNHFCNYCMLQHNHFYGFLFKLSCEEIHHLWVGIISKISHRKIDSVGFDLIFEFIDIPTLVKFIEIDRFIYSIKSTTIEKYIKLYIKIY